MKKRRVYVLVIVILALEGLFFLQVRNYGKDAAPTEPSLTPVMGEETESFPEPPTEMPTEAPTEAPTEPDAVEAYLENMTLQEKVYQMFFVTQEQLTGVYGVTEAGEATRDALEAMPVGGIIYFRENLQDREQVKKLISDTNGFSRTGLFFATDEEGGAVTRLGDRMGVTDFGPMGSVAGEEEAYTVGATLGAQMLELGFGVDFAPVADVNTNPWNMVIGNRAFSSDPEEAARLVAACVRGFRDSGLSCCLKHFPGHGDTESDSHYEQAAIYKDLKTLRKEELLPFAAGIAEGAEFVMVGHISAPEINGDDLPATLSSKMINGILRQELGFSGIVITDSMQMGAVTERFSAAEAAVMAVEAGADMLLMPENLYDAAQGVLAAVEEGRLSESRIDESVYRILRLKYEKGIL